MVIENKSQTIRLQMANVEGVSDTVLLVDSDAKTAKENSMYELFTQRYEDGPYNMWYILRRTASYPRQEMARYFL